MPSREDPDLYHYYEQGVGPFMNLSDLAVSEAQAILDRIKRTNVTFAAHRYDGYLERRRELESLARSIFVSKGGTPRREAPHYMVVGECPWLATWHLRAGHVAIPLHAFDPRTVSFTYGDLFPTFSPRVTDGREYRRQVYTWEEMRGLIDRYGLPQEWNPDGAHGPERYIEVQVWCDPRRLDVRRSLSAPGPGVAAAAIADDAAAGKNDHRPT